MSNTPRLPFLAAFRQEDEELHPALIESNELPLLQPRLRRIASSHSLEGQELNGVSLIPFRPPTGEPQTPSEENFSPSR